MMQARPFVASADVEERYGPAIATDPVRDNLPYLFVEPGKRACNRVAGVWEKVSHGHYQLLQRFKLLHIDKIRVADFDRIVAHLVKPRLRRSCTFFLRSSHWRTQI
jgi:hypothetical protein